MQPLLDGVGGVCRISCPIFVVHVPHGGLSAAKSLGESPDRLSGVVLDGLGHGLHVSGRSVSPRSAGFRGLLQNAPRRQLRLDPMDSPQHAAVQRHLSIRLPGSRRGAQVLRDNLSFQLIFMTESGREGSPAFLWRVRVTVVRLLAIGTLLT